jgi:hypothetical protein
MSRAASRTAASSSAVSTRKTLYVPLLLVVPVLVLFATYLLSSPEYALPHIITKLEPKVALLLTAHPDDEVMFFSPTILGLQGLGWRVKGLCLSAGRMF